MAKLVRFSDGMYGVRRFSLFTGGFEYLDLDSPMFWWTRSSADFRCCRGMHEKAVKAYAFALDKGVPVSDVDLQGAGDE